jgi:hypothetical protein
MIKNITIEDVGLGNSFYSFAGRYACDEASKPSTQRTLHRFCSLMRKMDVETAIIEDLLPEHPAIKKEIDAIQRYYKNQAEIIAYRVTCLNKKIRKIEEIRKCGDDDFLSSALLINFKSPKSEWKSYLFRAIVTTPKLYNRLGSAQVPLLNTYLHVSKTFDCEVSEAEGRIHGFKITGTYFSQQNGVTSVCCHAALSTCINNVSFLPLGEIEPEYINNVLGIDHVKTRFGNGEKEMKGLTLETIDDFFEKVKINSLWISFFDNPLVEYNNWIYHYIESECPVLLFFTTNNPNDLHVVSVLGHTFLSDIWRSEAEPVYSLFTGRLEYKPASNWVDNFIIHDDNFGMNLCLPIDSLKRSTLPRMDPTFRAYYAAIILPQTVKTEAVEAEYASSIISKVTLETLKKTVGLDIWSDRLFANPSSKVIRTFLVSKTQYEYNLTRSDFAGNGFSEEDQIKILKDLPTLFWLSEISLIDLYCANKTKIIDFFYGCNNPKLKDPDEVNSRWIKMRLPSILLTNHPGSQPSSDMLSVNSHYPLLKFQNHKDSLEW